MNTLLELRKQMEIDFLKTKTYEEINDMFNQLNDNLKLAESIIKKSDLSDITQILNEFHIWSLTKEAMFDDRLIPNYIGYLKVIKDELNIK